MWHDLIFSQEQLNALVDYGHLIANNYSTEKTSSKSELFLLTMVVKLDLDFSLIPAHLPQYLNNPFERSAERTDRSINLL